MRQNLLEAQFYTGLGYRRGEFLMRAKAVMPSAYHDEELFVIL
jgi:hypothetical protein